MKLLIISHTEHFLGPDGTLLGWSPTVNEINHLAGEFDHIYHLACFYKGPAPAGTMAYKHPNITFVKIPVTGGSKWWQKLSILMRFPGTWFRVLRYLRKVDVFQLRVPFGMATLLIPCLSLLTRKKGWYKYAGNWRQPAPPLGYQIQRWLLKKQGRIVTVNGNWSNEPAHIIAFENPCFTQVEYEAASGFVSSRQFAPPFNLVFVGRLEDAKGVDIILEVLKNADVHKLVAECHLIGDGTSKAAYQAYAKDHGLPCIFHGFLDRDLVFDRYRSSHFILLPSRSEGFPKVVAEAMSVGCIPIVSDVSSLGQYITKENGYTLGSHNTNDIVELFRRIDEITEDKLKEKSAAAYHTSSLFTFEHYIKHIKSKIIHE